MSHFIQAMIGSKRVLDWLQQRFERSCVIELSQGLFLLPIFDGLFDESRRSNADAYTFEDFQFEFLSPAIIALLIEASQEETVAYIGTEYHGGAGNQGAVVARAGTIVLAPIVGDDTINSALRLLGATKGLAYDEFDAVGLSRFRSNEDWINQPHLAVDELADLLRKARIARLVLAHSG